MSESLDEFTTKWSEEASKISHPIRRVITSCFDKLINLTEDKKIEELLYILDDMKSERTLSEKHDAKLGSDPLRRFFYRIHEAIEKSIDDIAKKQQALESANLNCNLAQVPQAIAAPSPAHNGEVDTQEQQDNGAMMPAPTPANPTPATIKEEPTDETDQRPNKMQVAKGSNQKKVAIGQTVVKVEDAPPALGNGNADQETQFITVKRGRGRPRKNASSASATAMASGSTCAPSQPPTPAAATATTLRRTPRTNKSRTENTANGGGGTAPADNNSPAGGARRNSAGVTASDDKDRLVCPICKVQGKETRVFTSVFAFLNHLSNTHGTIASKEKLVFRCHCGAVVTEAYDACKHKNPTCPSSVFEVAKIQN